MSDDPQQIPKGFQIYEDRLFVAGVKYRKGDAIAFANAVNADDGWIELERDPDNPHDKNAIKVIGCTKGFFGTKRRFIGFIPKEIAARIAQKRLWPELRGRLADSPWVTPDGQIVEIRIQIIGPKARIDEYRITRSNDDQVWDNLQMTLTACKKCQKEISPKAKVCPHCGHKPRRT